MLPILKLSGPDFCLASNLGNCIFCSVNWQQWGAHNVSVKAGKPQKTLIQGCYIASPPCPSSLLSRSVVLSLDERSWDWFCLYIAMLAQPLEKSACRRPPDPLKVCFQRKLRAGRQRAFFFSSPSPSAALLKLFSVSSAVWQDWRQAACLSALTPTSHPTSVD